MNQTYNEIAKIIKNRIELIKSNITKKYQEVLLVEMKLLANEFADNFEREENKGLPKGMVTSPDSLEHFNRKQFLKLVGVEE